MHALPPRRLLALAPLVVLAACGLFPENEYLPPPYPPHLGYRFHNLRADVANTDSVLVCVSFSGGGTRAGAMAYGVIEAMRETFIAGGKKRLLDEVDIVSAASGGSFPAAYLGTFGADAFLADFREEVLLRDLGMETFWRGTLCPYNLVRICSPWFNRSDLAAELYEDTIFGEATFSDLQRRGRPFVVLNATDLAAGARFEFTQERFERLGSSLGRVSVARAVAASSAFPVLLTPVAFRDYTVAGEEERYVHLVDGGIVDNLGLGYVLESYRRGVVSELVEAGRVETLVFVIVNARVRPPDEMGRSGTAPGAFEALAWSMDAAIDRRADDQHALLVELSQRSTSDAGGGGGPAVHVIEVDLDDVPDPQRRARLLAVETTFGLDEEVVDELIEVAGDLLRASPGFVKLRAALR